MLAAGMVNIITTPVQESAKVYIPAMVRLVYLATTKATNVPTTAAAPGAILKRVVCSVVKPKAEMIEGPAKVSLNHRH